MSQSQNNYFGGSSTSSISGLSTSELNQLKNIGTTIIPPDGWVSLSLLNQALATTSSVQFNKCTLKEGLALVCGSSSSTITLQAPALAANRTVTLPDADMVLGSHAALPDVNSGDYKDGGHIDLTPRVVSNVAPWAADKKYKIGTIWCKTDPLQEYLIYILSAFDGAIPIWRRLIFQDGDFPARPGNATTPSIHFDTETNTGIYWQEQGVLGVTVAGSKKAAFTTTGVNIGKLGVGQDPGTEALEVTGNIKIANQKALICHTVDPCTSALVADFTNNGGNGIAIKSTYVSNRGNSLDFTYRDYNSGSALTGIALGISPTGTIGINQTAGGEALEVTGNIKTTGKLIMPDVVGSSATTPNRISLHPLGYGFGIDSGVLNYDVAGTASKHIFNVNGAGRVEIRNNGIGIIGDVTTSGSLISTGAVTTFTPTCPTSAGIGYCQGASGSRTRTGNIITIVLFAPWAMTVAMGDSEPLGVTCNGDIPNLIDMGGSASIMFSSGVGHQVIPKYDTGTDSIVFMLPYPPTNIATGTLINGNNYGFIHACITAIVSQ